MENKLTQLEATKALLEERIEGQNRHMQALASDINLLEQLLALKSEYNKTINAVNTLIKDHGKVCEEIEAVKAEAEKAKYEAQQDAVIEPLTYEQTMLELEKNQKDARLKRIEAELQSYTELASKEAESMAPTFGLR